MKDLYIHNTNSTPEVRFEKSGKLRIAGKSLPEDPKKFFDPLFKWINELDSERVDIQIKLEYVNTSSSKRIIELLKSIDNNTRVKKVDMNWYYEVDDADMLEFGEMIQHSLRRTKANYIEYSEEED
ncbi:MAG: nuclear pore complex subunit [Marinilabiliales bacterium]|nr:MAG: nuclear pore complex subunit [Marinilabiliales bacterium]